METARSLGLKVILKPHVDSQDGLWRAHITPSDPNRWFESYGGMVRHYATLAQPYGASLCIGAELITLATDAQYESRWRALIADRRQRTTGKLLYGANWGTGWAEEFTRVPFWDALDYLGISAYFILADTTTPTVQQLRDRWTAWRRDTIDGFQQQWNKPVLFIEGGYRSADGTAREPFNSWSNWPLDTQEQVDTYEALFQTWAEVPWFAGTALWAWNINTQVSPTDIWYEVQNKPAHARVVAWFGGSSTQPPGPPTIQIRNPLSDQRYSGTIAVTAFATNVRTVTYRVDEQPEVAMSFDAASGLWQAVLDTRTLTNGQHHVTVTGTGDGGPSVEDRAWNILVENAASSPTPSPSPSAAPTPSPTPSPTPRPSPTPSPSPTPTPAATVTPTPGKTPPPTASPSPSPSALPSASPTSSPLPPATNLIAMLLPPASRPAIELRWTGSAGASNYVIERATDAAFSTVTAVAEVSAPTSYRDDADVARNVTYY